LHLKEIWDKDYWIFEGQHEFRPGLSCESQIITICQDIADSLNNGIRTDAIIIDMSKFFNLVPHDRLLRKIADLGVNPRVVVWLTEFLLGRIRKVRIGRLLSEEVRVTSGIPHGSVLGRYCSSRT
jgi:hypothetical protein